MCIALDRCGPAKQHDTTHTHIHTYTETAHTHTVAALRLHLGGKWMKDERTRQASCVNICAQKYATTTCLNYSSFGNGDARRIAPAAERENKRERESETSARVVQRQQLWVAMAQSNNILGTYVCVCVCVVQVASSQDSGRKCALLWAEIYAEHEKVCKWYILGIM